MKMKKMKKWFYGVIAIFTFLGIFIAGTSPLPPFKGEDTSWWLFVKSVIFIIAIINFKATLKPSK